MVRGLRAGVRVLVGRASIIGVALATAALLSGCNALRITYNNGPALAWWWIDGYFDFDRNQSPAVKAAIDRWFEWHRGTQLPEYAAFLAAVQPQFGAPMSAEQICRLGTQVRDRLDPAIDRGLVAAAELLPLLTDTQLKHLEGKYAKNLQDLREEYLQPDAKERLDKSVKRAIDRFEQLYGRLGDAQRKLIADGVAASPFDPQAWYDERQRRQKDVLQTLRRLTAERNDRDARIAALRALAEKSERSPDAAYRAYQQRLTDYNCAFSARVHNATTPAQRTKARETIKGYEDDLRALIAGNGGVPAGAAANGSGSP